MYLSNGWKIWNYVCIIDCLEETGNDRGNSMYGFKTNYSFEKNLPITIVLIIGIELIFGSLGFLVIGFYVTIILALVSAVVISTRYKTGLFIKDHIPVYISFAFIILLLIFSLYGMKIHRSDEFSYWGLVVKAMMYWGDLSTNPKSGIGFWTYPPGIGLIQYNLEMIHSWMGEFDEWLLYFSKASIYLCFCAPIVSEIKTKRKWIVLGILLILPTCFYPDFYYTLYGDPNIGAFTACGLIGIFLFDDDDILKAEYVLSCIFVLSLIKTTGIYFSILITILYLVDTFVRRQDLQIIKKNVLMVVLTLVMSIGIWKVDVLLSNADMPSSNPIDFNQLLNVILGNDASYRTQVWHNYLRAPLSIDIAKITIRFLCWNVEVPYIVVIIMSIIICIWVGVYRIKYKGSENKKLYRAVNIIIILHIFFFCIGNMLTYMFKFSVVQGVEISAYTRYMNAIFEYLVVSSVVLLILIFQNNYKSSIKD